MLQLLWGLNEMVYGKCQHRAGCYYLYENEGWAPVRAEMGFIYPGHDLKTEPSLGVGEGCLRREPVTGSLETELGMALDNLSHWSPHLIPHPSPISLAPALHVSPLLCKLMPLPLSVTRRLWPLPCPPWPQGRGGGGGGD